MARTSSGSADMVGSCSNGYREVEGCALPGLGFHPDPSAVAVDDLLGDRQTDAGAGILRTRMQPLKHRKNRFRIFRSDADAVVANRKLPLARNLPCRHMHDGRVG